MAHYFIRNNIAELPGFCKIAIIRKNPWKKWPKHLKEVKGSEFLSFLGSQY
jgi:hypothetical protein